MGKNSYCADLEQRQLRMAMYSVCLTIKSKQLLEHKLYQKLVMKIKVLQLNYKIYLTDFCTQAIKLSRSKKLITYFVYNLLVYCLRHLVYYTHIMLIITIHYHFRFIFHLSSNSPRKRMRVFISNMSDLPFICHALSTRR